MLDTDTSFFQAAVNISVGDLFLDSFLIHFKQLLRSFCIELKIGYHKSYLKPRKERNPLAPKMLQKPSQGKYFRLLAVVSFGFSIVPSSSSPAVGVPKGCMEVAIYAKKMAIERMTIDLRLVSNIIGCLKELHRLFRTTDWKEIHNMIPNAVKEVLRNVPNLGRKALAVATRTQGLLFIPLYSLFKALDMFYQVTTLDMEYKMYRKEFERLQVELELTIDQIHNELLPNWEHSSTTALQKSSTEVLRKLDRFYAELKHLAGYIKRSIDKSDSNRDLAVTSLIGSVFLMVASLATGNVPGAAISGAVGLTSIASDVALSRTIRRLESLQHEVEFTCIEIKEYRSYLVQELSQKRRAPTNDLSVAFLFLVAAFSLYLVYLVVSRETPVVDRPTGQTEIAGRRLQTGREGTRQRDRRAPRVRSAPAGIPRFRMPRVLSKIKYNHWHKNSLNGEAALPVESEQEENNNDSVEHVEHNSASE